MDYVVMTKKLTRSPGRPRSFDPAIAVETAQKLFHAYGYDAVSVSDVTDALNIKAPSFYAAFGSKAGLFTRVLDRYSHQGAIPLNEILRPDRPVAECLAELLEEAARYYAADPLARGCLVLEGVRCNDPDARALASNYYFAAGKAIHDFIAERYPQDASRLTDFISTIMAGLSAKARSGQSPERLLATARLAGMALSNAFPA